MSSSHGGYRSPLARARGLGSAKTGVGHWWMQRLTAIALLPLSLWIMFALALLPDLDYQTVHAFLAQPLIAIALIVLSVMLYYHSSLGVQVVLEDYIHRKWLKFTLLISVNFANTLLAVISLFFILKIAFGS